MKSQLVTLQVAGAKVQDDDQGEIEPDAEDDMGAMGDDELENGMRARQARRQRRKLPVLEDPKNKSAVTYLQVCTLIYVSMRFSAVSQKS